MRTVFVAMLFAVALSVAPGCGGKEKPPLTPDQENPALLGPDAGVEMPTSPPPPQGK